MSTPLGTASSPTWGRSLEQGVLKLSVTWSNDARVTDTIVVDRSRVVGLAIGSIWLAAVGLLFAMWALLSIGTNSAAAILAALVAAAAWVVVRGVSSVRASAPLPRTSDRTHAESAVARRFRLIVFTEVAAFAVVNPLLASTGHVDLLPAANLVIVGVHFFPLARLFHVPRYTALGAVFCVVPVAVMIGVPSTSTIGDAGAWFVLPTAICGAAAIAVALGGVAEARAIASLTPSC